MSTPPAPRGRVAVLGGGPAGMATALSVHQAGHEVVVFERYREARPAGRPPPLSAHQPGPGGVAFDRSREARPAGNILNPWPPPLKALHTLGVDTEDLGAPCRSQFRNSRGKVRATIRSAPEIEARYG